jgi:hypothetical protein
VAIVQAGDAAVSAGRRVAGAGPEDGADRAADADRGNRDFSELLPERAARQLVGKVLRESIKPGVIHRSASCLGNRQQD